MTGPGDPRGDDLGATPAATSAAGPNAAGPNAAAAGPIAAGPFAAADRARVRLLTRPGCHLCEDAREVVAAVCADLGESYEEVDITTDPALESEFTDQIPVTFVDGAQHDFWRVSPDRLRAALA